MLMYEVNKFQIEREQKSYKRLYRNHFTIRKLTVLDMNVSKTEGHSGQDPQNLKSLLGELGKILVDHYSMFNSNLSFRAPSRDNGRSNLQRIYKAKK